MTAAALHLADDYQLAFADWGEPIVIETVATTFDPQALLATESVTTTEVVGIVTPVKAEPTAETGGHHATERCTVQLLAADWSPPEVGLTRRLVFRSAVWEVVDSQLPALGQPVALTLRRL